MEWLITNAVAALLIPPGNLLLLAAIGALVARRRPRAGRTLVALSVIGLWALATPFVADALIRFLEPRPTNPVADPGGQAIVVLGGGIYFNAPEYGGSTVSQTALVRLRYAAYLQRTLRKPVLVAGGSPRGGTAPEAELMRQVLQREFQVPVQWRESASNNTLESARRSRLVLKGAGIQRIYLVTHAWHMPRARLAFERVGFTVIPAPTAFKTRLKPSVLDGLPDAHALRDSSLFFHEAIGLGWYHFRIAVGF